MELPRTSEQQVERDTETSAIIYSLEQVAMACNYAAASVLENDVDAAHRDLHGIIASLSLIHFGILKLLEEDDELSRKLN